MKTRFIITAIPLFFSLFVSQAQKIQNLSLDDVVQMALTTSDASKINAAQVTQAQQALKVTKNNQYPDVDISGQYRYLTNADVKLQIPVSASGGENSEEQATASPDVNGLLLGSANVSMPLFSGFKLKNSISASENKLQAAIYNAANDQEELALRAIQTYLNLYKANAHEI